MTGWRGESASEMSQNSIEASQKPWTMSSIKEEMGNNVRCSETSSITRIEKNGHSF